MFKEGKRVVGVNHETWVGIIYLPLREERDEDAKAASPASFLLKYFGASYLYGV